MRALSIKQPWLYCITDLDKRVENRTWKPPDWIIGQRIALHSSKKMGDLVAASDIAGFKLSTVANDMPLGAIVATARVDGWIDFLDSKWFSGPVGWILSDVVKLHEPVPHRGRLGLWEVSVELAIQ